jgi:predicted  nucleic acid-binding Zn-ribbon protein
MHQQGPDLEQRLSKLEAQLDRFSLSLQQWQQTQKHLQPVESRLTHLIEQSNDILDRWTSSEQQYGHTMQQELSALRQLHEEPVRELRERAASLGEICVAATSSISGLERSALSPPRAGAGAAGGGRGTADGWRAADRAATRRRPSLAA